jgi:hypothetical protein
MAISAEAQAAADYALPGKPLAPPRDLTPEQQDFWRALMVDFPSGWFRSDHVPVLCELVRHISYSRQIAEALALLRHCPLTRVAKNRAIVAQLLGLARDESRMIASLSTKLRLLPQQQEEKRIRAAHRDRIPPGRKPWEIHPRDDVAEH